MTHSATCTGCPRCNTVFAALAAAPPREQAQFNLARVNAQRIANAAPTVAAAVVPPSDVAPEPPSLVAAVNARRAGQTTYNLDAPVFGGGVRPYPVTVAAAHETIDEPPSLADAVKARRAR